MERDFDVNNAEVVTQTISMALIHTLVMKHAKSNPGKTEELLEKYLFYDVLSLSGLSNMINGKEEGLAFNRAHDALVMLDIDSTDGFMDLCRQYYNDPKRWPEYHDSDHPSNIKIIEFIGESLRTEHATDWGW